MFSLIACIGKNRELGKNGQLIFHLKKDMDFFQKTTLNHKVVMGRKTWESLPHKLQNRENIVISRHDFKGPDCIIHDIKQFIKENQDTSEEILIIGGSQIYQTFLPVAKKIYLTEVDANEPAADAFFPEFNRNNFSSIIIEKGTENHFKYQIIRYNRDI